MSTKKQRSRLELPAELRKECEARAIQELDLVQAWVDSAWDALAAGRVMPPKPTNALDRAHRLLGPDGGRKFAAWAFEGDGSPPKPEPLTAGQFKRLLADYQQAADPAYQRVLADALVQGVTGQRQFALLPPELQQDWVRRNPVP